MARTSWEKLMEQYADGRTICNCGQAYRSPVGEGVILGPDGKREERTDLMVCAYGCNSAQIAAREYIADRVLDVENPRDPVEKKTTA